MINLIRDLDNMVFRKYASDSVGVDSYAEAYAQYYVSKRKRNASLKDACNVFDSGYELRNKSGVLVNDLSVIAQKGVMVDIKKVNGEKYTCINLATNSYNDLDLAETPRKELAEYVRNESLSSCLSRKIAGSLPIHKKLEAEIADFMGYESCVLATCGYIAQQAVMTALFHDGDVIFSDQHNHSSLVDGMAISKAKVIVYPHLNYEKLEELVKKYRGGYNAAGIVSDGVFSAHGTLANLERIDQIKNKFNLMSVVDDTHGFLTVGDKGRGCIDFFSKKPDVVTSSLAKGLAGFGGMIVGSQAVIRAIDCHGRQNVNTSHLSPVVAAQSYFNLIDYRTHFIEYRKELFSLLTDFNNKLGELGIRQYPDADTYIHPIFSFEGDDEAKVLRVYQDLLECGFMGAMFPVPVAPNPTIRLSLHRSVDPKSLNLLAEKLKEHGMQPLTKKFWPNLHALKKHSQVELVELVKEECA
ncbi:MAG: 7-keto-8-aminopelargonate synthetase-like enzyme [Bermanella sp.]|jgi:7-keto-8-aminopelargonate synthetase-like enzyme